VRDLKERGKMDRKERLVIENIANIEMRENIHCVYVSLLSLFHLFYLYAI